MTKKKKPAKVKQLVRVREKALSNGNVSLYLDIYHSGKRSYEFLKMYIVAEKTAADREQNKNTRLLAETIRADRQKALLNGQAGVVNNLNSKVTLKDWLEILIQEYEEKGKSVVNLKSTLKAVCAFKGDIRLQDIKKDYYMDFSKHLQRAKIILRNGEVRTYSKYTILNYLRVLNIAINKAVENDIISVNPFSKLTEKNSMKIKKGVKAYLTKEELKTLLNTIYNIQHKEIYRAFAFACFVGLRLSDIEALKWGQIVTSNGQQQIEMVMKKTDDKIYLPLSANALKWLPVRGGASDKDNVFKLLTRTQISYALHKWAEAAGINKNITFHVARHTFATMLLTEGADIYTISKLLGHSNIQTTQIYTKVVNVKKEEAVHLLDKIDF
ncbi:MAG: site-specific integrase [Bacteroidaceae bacterium]|nr:site-specific integrase [Bacteroidaceae bacterium]